MQLTTDIHLVPRLGISGDIPLLPLYAFMAWTLKPLHLHYRKHIITLYKAAILIRAVDIQGVGKV
jgi:hypothetical protein